MARTAIHVDGVDVLAAEFTRNALNVQGEAKDLVVDYADKAAAMMRNTVPVRTGTLRRSITADSSAKSATWGVWAEAGPTSPLAHFQERGTIHHAPQPFVNPAADRLEPEFGRAASRLGGWL